MKPRMIDGLKVVEAEPGSPPPPGVPSWAVRCDLLETPHCPPALRPWVIAAGALGTAGCVATIGYFGQWGAIAPLPLSLAVLWYGLRPGMSRKLEPSATGRYLAFEEDSENGAAAVAGRLAALVVGAMMLFGAGNALLSEARDWLAASSLGMFGLALLYFGVTGKDLPDGKPSRASLRFRALADPARPLAADDPVTIAPPPAIHPGAALDDNASISSGEEIMGAVASPRADEEAVT
jgi:hypothetical protein